MIKNASTSKVYIPYSKYIRHEISNTMTYVSADRHFVNEWRFDTRYTFIRLHIPPKAGGIFNLCSISSLNQCPIVGMRSHSLGYAGE